MFNKYSLITIFIIVGAVLGLMPALVCAHPAFPIGWYDKIGVNDLVPGWDWQWKRDTNEPAIFAAEHCNIVMPYLMEARTPRDVNIISAYLDQAQAAGVKVIMQIQPTFFANASNITWFVNHYWKNFPAVYGWYTADEPPQGNPDGYTVGRCVDTYNYISLYGYGYGAPLYGMGDSNKPPVFITFTPMQFRDNNEPYNYRNAYDIMIGDCYPFYIGDPEFGDPADPITGTTYWTASMDHLKAKADSLGKKWWAASQAFGTAPDGKFPTGNYRQLTTNEERYCMYYAVMNGCSGLLFFDHQYATDAWLTNVFRPLTLEFSTYADAIKNGPYSGGGVSNNTSGVVKSVIFADELNGGWYLITANRSYNNSQSSTFTITLPHGTGAISALPMNEGGRSAITINSSTGQFTDTFTKWQVHIYKLQGYTSPTYNCDDIKNEAFLAGNVNGDCKVDMKDFAEVAQDWLKVQ